MRTSNKILIASFALLTISLAFYDFRLKAEYQKKDYTDAYREFVKLDYKNFNAVELESSTAVNIMLVQGPFKVAASPGAMDFLDIRQKKNRLVIGIKFPDHWRGIGPEYAIYISCPSLSSFKADASYMIDDTKVTDTIARDADWRPTMINGFTADSLNIQQDHASNVALQNNRIKHLTATVGVSDQSRSILTVGQNNKFDQADLTILNRSHLWIRGTNFNNINYHLADSASLIINGAEAKHLLNLK
ncbi:MAG TPA: hypothetical protein VIM89_10350 [Mucilaginibacter sp.]